VATSSSLRHEARERLHNILLCCHMAWGWRGGEESVCAHLSSNAAWLQTPSPLLWIQHVLTAWCFQNSCAWISRHFRKNRSPTFLWNDTDHIENVSNYFSVVAYIFIAVVTFLPSCCLAAIRKYAHRLMGGIYEVCCWDGFMFHDICTKFHKDRFRHSKVDLGGGGVDIQTHRLYGDLISLL
jgi:hypothetical protein